MAHISSGVQSVVRVRSCGDELLPMCTSKQNLKIIEVPIHYGARTYGDTNISRFSDGFLLLRMVGFAFMKLKAI